MRCQASSQYSWTARMSGQFSIIQSPADHMHGNKSLSAHVTLRFVITPREVRRVRVRIS